LGRKKIPSWGILIKTDRLRPVIVYQKADTWVVQEISTRIQNSKGSMSDFLDPFRGDTNAPYMIRCESRRSASDLLDPSLGEFLSKEAEQLPKDANHLCFELDIAYNNWGCFSFVGKHNAPETTFVQLLTD